MRGFLERTTAELVAIPSPSGKETALADYVCARLREEGLRPHRDVEDNAWVEVGAGKKRLILNAHLDTVIPVAGWETDPFKATVKGDRLYGLGASDCKAGVAALLWLATRIEPKVRVLISFTVCEEGLDLLKPNGSEAIAAMGGDWAVACEPTCEEGKPVIGIGTQGHARAFVKFRGKAAHSSRPEDGRNAIEAAARFCVELAQLNASYVATEIVPGSKARSTVAPTIISGGTLSNIIPDAAEVTVSRRLAPGETAETFREELDRLLAGADANFTIASDGAGALTRRDGILLEMARRAAGKGAREAFFRGRTDAIIYARHGMDTLTMGPGEMGQCHVANEYVDLKGAVAAVRVLEGLVNSLTD